jgi:threonine/homoserine/homoserine lactone efflux protein
MELSAVLGFAAVAFALIAVPGPDWAYVLAAGARDHVATPVVGGILIGYALITAVVVAGVAPLVAAVPMALVALTICGAGYLTYLGVRTLRSTGHLDVGSAAAPASSPLRYLARGIGVSAFNPKGLLIFLAVLQFTRTAAGWPLPVQLATLGGVFIAICALLHLPLGHTAHRVLGARPAAANATTKVAGASMILVGLVLLAERVLQLFGRT